MSNVLANFSGTDVKKISVEMDSNGSDLLELSAKFKNGDLLTLVKKTKGVHKFYELAYRELVNPVVKFKLFKQKKWFIVTAIEYFTVDNECGAIDSFSARVKSPFPRNYSGRGILTEEHLLAVNPTF